MSAQPLSLPDRPTRLRRVDAGDVRRRQLIEATIVAIAEVGFNATTIAEIARRAEVSTGLVSFYFGDKDGLLEATLRHLARQLSRAAAARMRDAATPRARVQAVIDTMLGRSQFERRIGTVWLAFWGQVPHSPRFARVQRAYHRRIASNLAHALRPILMPEPARALAETIASMIDGLWLRATLANDPDGRMPRAVATGFVDSQFMLLGLGR
ncbi:transcriptional regulator BetI [Labrys sp. LIt4]|uniref:HTH-type transcriptional regulator BetI n=1 Tax=Labrys okinawensis TaxID=346911 RepID=A0A2S9QHI4_9HYPH|nr:MULTISPECIES: transcriptional regulator BetI [Labrys]MBP0579741.1 transcriptional regulator BetI [Labrys sp. LIt4]PRH88827.1 transcriptional regulator BetI [Labrys okinawensis]